MKHKRKISNPINLKSIYYLQFVYFNELHHKIIYLHLNFSVVSQTMIQQHSPLTHYTKKLQDFQFTFVYCICNCYVKMHIITSNNQSTIDFGLGSSNTITIDYIKSVVQSSVCVYTHNCLHLMFTLDFYS